MLAVALALASSAAIGATDFLAGYRARRLGVFTVLVVSQFSSVLILLLAFAFQGEGLPGSSEFWLLILLSGVAQVAAVTAFWHGLTVGAMGIVAPITATGAAIPVGVGLAAGDRPELIEMAGIAAAVIGVILVSYEPVGRRSGTGRFAEGIGFALAAAVGIGVFYVAIDGAVDHANALTTSAANRIASAGLLLLPAVLLRNRLSATAKDLPSLVAIGVLEVSGILLFAAAAGRGFLVIVGAIAALYPLTTVILARIVLHERLHVAQRSGALIAVIGVATVSASAA